MAISVSDDSDLYLDANSTTRVLKDSCVAVLATMVEDYGNPSSAHRSGARARLRVEAARERASRVLAARTGRLVFTSGATEAIHTAVLSALISLKHQPSTAGSAPLALMYGATEHRAVIEALKHWNTLLGLNLPMVAVPVRTDGRHDLGWLRQRVGQAGLICTTAVNGETGVISDLAGIASIVASHACLWLVNAAHALGHLPLRLDALGASYVSLSGHKACAPKGVGLLYVAHGVPYTPVLTGGDQEAGARSGTENVPAIAGFDVVLQRLEDGVEFRDAESLSGFRAQIVGALNEALPGLVFNAPLEHCVPTTLNFSVPGVPASHLLDMFEAAGLQVSSSTSRTARQVAACDVLHAMGLPAWQADSAVRLSLPLTCDSRFVQQACDRILTMGQAWQESTLLPSDPTGIVRSGVSTHTIDGVCCHVVCDAVSRRCVVIDPFPAAVVPLAHSIRRCGFQLVAALDTHLHPDGPAARHDLWSALSPGEAPQNDEADGTWGWPQDVDRLNIGCWSLTRWALPDDAGGTGGTGDSVVYLLHDRRGVRLAFVGNTLWPCQTDSPTGDRDALPFPPRGLADAIGANTLLVPAHDPRGWAATTLAVEALKHPLLRGYPRDRLGCGSYVGPTRDTGNRLRTPAGPPELSRPEPDVPCLQITRARLNTLLRLPQKLVVVDVREPVEQRLAPAEHRLGYGCTAMPASQLLGELPQWMRGAPTTTLVMVCRDGQRSSHVALTLRRLGHPNVHALMGGLSAC